MHDKVLKCHLLVFGVLKEESNDPLVHLLAGELLPPFFFMSAVTTYDSLSEGVLSWRRCWGGSMTIWKAK
jgi:hypothetical protein